MKTRTIQYDVKCEVWHRTTYEVNIDLTTEQILEQIESGELEGKGKYLYETVNELKPTGRATKELSEVRNQSELILWDNATT